MLAAFTWRQALAEESFTCVSSRSASTIDWFVLADALLPAVKGVRVDDEGTEVRTHRPVQLELAGTARNNTIHRFRKPSDIRYKLMRRRFTSIDVLINILWKLRRIPWI